MLVVIRLKGQATNPWHRGGAAGRSHLFPANAAVSLPQGVTGQGLQGWLMHSPPPPCEHRALGAGGGQALGLTMEDRSTFSTLLSCSCTGCRPATWSCTEDVRYTKLSSQSPLQAQSGWTSASGAPDKGGPHLAPRNLVGLVPLWETRALTVPWGGSSRDPGERCPRRGSSTQGSALLPAGSPELRAVPDVQ